MSESLLGFSSDTFARRRERIAGSLDGGALVLPAAPLLRRSRDTEVPYRPDSELFYLTGCTDPQVVSLFRDGPDGPALTLFVPERDPDAELWSGPRRGPDRARELFGADAAHPLRELDDRLPGLLKGASRVFFRLGAHPRVEPLVVRALSEARARGPRKGEGPRGVMDPGVVLDDLRIRKEPEEVERIRKATGITVAAFRAALAGVGAGKGEWEVEAALESGFRRRRARGPAFPTIVGSGPNACILHYDENDRRMEGGDLVLLDGGAEVDLYCGDVTRTVPVAGGLDTVRRAVYEVVREAHGAAVAAVAPGVAVGEVHAASARALTEGLVRLKVLRGEVDGLVEREAYKAFFPHQTSHWLGLDVHDVGDYAATGESRVLEPGMVLTVEPGLYFGPGTLRGMPEEGDEDAARAFEGIGVRIEDDLLVTDGGAENLTGDLPVDVEELEELVGSPSPPKESGAEAW